MDIYNILLKPEELLGLTIIIILIARNKRPSRSRRAHLIICLPLFAIIPLYSFNELL